MVHAIKGRALTAKGRTDGRACEVERMKEREGKFERQKGHVALKIAKTLDGWR